jgi:DNA-directed RNA polymerase specialized sigma24 family protein
VPDSHGKQVKPRTQPDPFIQLLQQLGDANTWWPSGRTLLKWMIVVVVGIAHDVDRQGRLFSDDLKSVAILVLLEWWSVRDKVKYPRAWCRTVARRHLLDELNQTPLHTEELLESGLVVAGPWETLEYADSPDEMPLWFKEEILPHLEPVLRDVVVLVFVKELDYAAAARQLKTKNGEMTEATLRVYVSRARKRIDEIVAGIIDAAIEELPEEIRRPMRMYLLPPFNPPWEIQNHTEIGEDAIRSAIRRGIRELRRHTKQIVRLWPRLWEPLEQELDND